jgi:aspartate/glutamate racemase
MIAPHVVGILGGMGPAAGSDFSRLFVNACEAVLVARGEPVTDQAFPNTGWPKSPCQTALKPSWEKKKRRCPECSRPCGNGRR